MTALHKTHPRNRRSDEADKVIANEIRLLTSAATIHDPKAAHRNALHSSTTQAATLSKRDWLTVCGLAVNEVVAGLALAIWLLAWPPFFSLYYPNLRGPAHAHDARAIVHWLASSQSAEVLNSAIVSGSLTAKEINHYLDVRRWLQRMPWVLVVCCASGLILVRAMRSSANAIALAQWGTVILTLLLVCTAGLLALWNWRFFFSAIHYPFFGATSWRFPKASYSLQLFPQVFWRCVGSLVFLGPLSIAAAVALFQRGHTKGSVPSIGN